MTTNSPTTSTPHPSETTLEAARALSIKDKAKEKAKAAGQSAGETADHASTRVGSAMVSASKKVASAGHYLEDTHPADMVKGANESLTEVMRAHPRMTIGVGLAAGFLLARAIRG